MNKKFCLVSYCDIFLLPYAKIYIDKIIESGNDCDILYWNREKKSNQKNKLNDKCNLIYYQYDLSNVTNNFTKLLKYFSCTKYFNNVLANKKYDGIIFLQTHSAILLKKILLKNYKNRYIIDVRDYTLENFALYRKIESKMIFNSYNTVISSEGYKEFLPNYNYTIAHNYYPFDEFRINDLKTQNKNLPININFVGTIRFIEQDKKILNLFKNNPNFVINYYGMGSNVLKDFAFENNITNCNFYGVFSQSETLKFYVNCHFINNVYGNNDKFLDYALSNKLYHCIQLHIPLLVSPNTFMETIVNKYNIGLSIDINNKETPSKILEWYENFIHINNHNGFDEFLDKVKKENAEFYLQIDKFIREV